MLTFKKRVNQDGFTLVELLVALLISAILITGLVSIYFSVVQHGGRILNANRLYEQMSAAMELMSGDIRRAGYWSQASSDYQQGTNSNPFMAPSTRLSVNGSNDCILLTFDNNGDGVLSSVNSGTDDEHYGYRLSGNAVQARPTSAAFNCTAASSAWENITDPKILTITGLTFTVTQKTVNLGSTWPTGMLTLTYVDISLSGQLANDSTMRMTMTNHIKVRNDLFSP